MKSVQNILPNLPKEVANYKNELDYILNMLYDSENIINATPSSFSEINQVSFTHKVLFFDIFKTTHKEKKQFKLATGLLVLTNKRLLYLSKVMFKVKLKEINFKTILSAECENGLLLSDIVLQLQHEKIKFGHIRKEIALKMTMQINSACNNNLDSLDNKIQSTDIISELERLAKLKKDKVISDEEFEILKAKAINKN